jgi:hypothetical protein
MSMTRNQRLIISYLTMRRFIGVLGISLPIIVVVGGFVEHGFVIQGSISGYYYTNMRDFFVGLLCIVSMFLISYQGYERIDNMISTLSGLFAFGMIIFPTGMFCGKVVKVGMFLIDDNVSELIHLTFGTLFFLALSYNSLFLFTKRHSHILIAEKRRRNILYRVCGLVMIFAMCSIIIYMFFLRDTVISRYYPVLILESIALFAFGISWLVKGNTFFKDQKNHTDE